jgi:tetratricopeptide (TPR) repeat protein
LNQIHWAGSRPAALRLGTTLLAITVVSFSVSAGFGQSQAPDWPAQVRKFVDVQDWYSALRVVDQEIARAPKDVDARAWRARLLVWSGQLVQAEQEYLEILKTSPRDPDYWQGLAGVYLREGKIPEAQRAIDTGVELDPKRADLHAARARVLRAAGKRDEARSEFQAALHLDPASSEARAGMTSVRREPKHELRAGQDNDLLNFADAYRDECMSLASQWNSHWASSVAGNFYQRGGAAAGKFIGSVTRRQPKWGAVTVGGAIGHDNGVIPRSEAFFGLDHGLKTGESNFVRAVEFLYGQHWYWYQSSRILALNGGAIIYFPQEWTFTLAATGSRSVFSGTSAEWRPSENARLGFPLAHRGEKRLSGNIFFAAGTENFAEVDQIGRFASQTYGGGLRFQFNARQDLTGYAGYQKRTQGRTDTSFGLSYGIHF